MLSKMSEYLPLADELRLIPRCMSRIFSNLHSVTLLACSIVQCPFGDIACERLYFALVRPKSNCFMLEWSSLYSGELFHSSWKWLSSRAPQVAVGSREDSPLMIDREIRWLTSSYEKFLLDVVAENVYRYTNLRTVIVDLSRTDHSVSYPFSPNVDRWAAVIKSLLSQCATSLNTFVINDHPFSFVPALSVHFKTSLAPALLRMVQLQILFAPLRIFYGCMKGEEEPSMEQITAEWQGTLLELGMDNAESGVQSKVFLTSLRRAAFWNFIRSETNWFLSPISTSLRLPQVERVEYELRAALPLRDETSAENLQRLFRRTFPRAVLVQGEQKSQRHYTWFDYHYSYDAIAAADMNAPAVAVDVYCISKIDEAVAALAGSDQWRICRQPSKMHITIDLSAVKNMKGFGVVLPIIARKSPAYWKFVLKISGTEPWASARDVLKHWQCTCGGGSADEPGSNNDGERCLCLRSQCKLNLYFTSRQSLSEILRKWETESRSMNNVTNHDSSSNVDQNLFAQQININCVKFRQLIDAGGRVAADAAEISTVQQRMAESMISILHDAVEARKHFSTQRFSATVYANIRRIDYDVFRAPLELVGQAQNLENQTKDLAFSQILSTEEANSRPNVAGNLSALDEVGLQLGSVRIPPDEKSSAETMSATNEVYFTTEANSKKLLPLPKLRKVFVDVKKL